MKLITFAAAVALATLPAIGSPNRAHHDATSPITQSFTYSLLINADCTLALDSTGTITFTAISGLGSGSAEATSVNNAKSTCSATTAYLNVTDGAPTNSTNYTLASGSNHITYQVCPNSGGTGCYTNSTGGSGQITVATNGTQTTTPMFGYLPAQGVNTPGTYTDLITVTLTFS